MDLGTIAQLGIACAIAVGAKREMASFRTLFKETLDKLAERVTADGARLEDVAGRVASIELAVEALAEMVETEDEEEEAEEVSVAGFRPSVAD